MGRRPRAPRRDDPDVDGRRSSRRTTTRATTRSGPRASTTTWSLHTHSGAGPTDISFGPGHDRPDLRQRSGFGRAARPMHVLILGGVFERFPTLHYCRRRERRVVGPDLARARWTRSGSATTTRAEVRHRGVPRWLTMKPGDYIDRNCWLGASTDAPDRDRPPLRASAIDNLMWGNDFPHPEGTWPHTREWSRMRFHDVPRRRDPQDPRENALRCYPQLDRARCATSRNGSGRRSTTCTRRRAAESRRRRRAEVGRRRPA